MKCPFHEKTLEKEIPVYEYCPMREESLQGPCAFLSEGKCSFKCVQCGGNEFELASGVPYQFRCKSCLFSYYDPEAERISSILGLRSLYMLRLFGMEDAEDS